MKLMTWYVSSSVRKEKPYMVQRGGTMQAFSDPTRADDCHALPDLELWFEDDRTDGMGWYYWFCFPGCLPDSDVCGPFDTCDEALDDARGDQ